MNHLKTNIKKFFLIFSIYYIHILLFHKFLLTLKIYISKIILFSLNQTSNFFFFFFFFFFF